MEINPIRTVKDYKAALKVISRLMESDPELGTPDGDCLDVLATLVEAYERKHYPIDLPDPVEAIKFRMGARRADAQGFGTNDWATQSGL